MMNWAYNFFRREPKKRKSDFSYFFRYASSSEQSKLLKQVAREANEEQRDLMEQYKRQRQEAL